MQTTRSRQLQASVCRQLRLIFEDFAEPKTENRAPSPPRWDRLLVRLRSLVSGLPHVRAPRAHTEVGFIRCQSTNLPWVGPGLRTDRCIFANLVFHILGVQHETDPYVGPSGGQENTVPWGTMSLGNPRASRPLRHVAKQNYSSRISRRFASGGPELDRSHILEDLKYASSARMLPLRLFQSTRPRLQ